eukprot:s4794_g1.t1
MKRVCPSFQSGSFSIRRFSPSSPPSRLAVILWRFRMAEFSDTEKQMLQGIWPLDLLEDPMRRPRVVFTAKEFLREVLVADHLGDFIVLPNGVKLLGLTEEDQSASPMMRCREVMPPELTKALNSTSSVQDLLKYFQADDALLDKYKAGLEYVDSDGEQRGVLPKERRNLRGRIAEILRLVQEGQVDPKSLYIAEMRLLHEGASKLEKLHRVLERAQPLYHRSSPCGSGSSGSSGTARKDVLGPLSKWTFYWDRHDEGVFIGNQGSGKGVHVDQVLWSNAIASVMKASVCF